MTTVVVAGSTVNPQTGMQASGATQFAVIDFSTPSNPVSVLVLTPFLSSVVDCAGTLAAVGDYYGSQVEIYDISNPASPTKTGSVNTSLSGISALSFDGTHVLVGEMNGQRVVLVDVSNPAAPSVLSTFTSAVASISAIALKGVLAVASGPNDLFFAVLQYDFSNPGNAPTQVQFVPGTGNVYFGGAITCDLDGTQAAVGDYGDSTVYLFDVSTGAPTLLGQYQSTQSGISSISVAGNIVVAASTNDTTMSVVDFSSPTNPVGKDTQSNLGGGTTVKIAGNFLAAGATNGFDVSLFSVAGDTETALGGVDTAIGPIESLGYTSFTPVTPEPQIMVSPTSLSFGAVRVGTQSPAQSLTIKNAGSAPLTVSNLTTSTSEYAATPHGSLPTLSPGQSTAVHVTFTPSASQSYPAQLTAQSNDPVNPSVSVALSGTGGEPHLVLPAPLAFGSVAVCLAHTLNATMTNTGSVDLHLSAITATGADFSASPSSLTIPAGSAGNIQVTFRPTATGTASGMLNLLSDDPSNPTPSLALGATGTSEPPPTVSVSPSAVNFGAVPLQYFVGIPVTVANIGPCEPLDVTLTVTGAAFLLTTGDPTTVPTANPPISATISAGTSENYTVVFNPVSIGSTTGMLTVTSNDPAHPSVSVPLTGTGVTVSLAAVELVLDRSGSMATAITGGTRMTALHSAVDMFANLVIPGAGFALGSVQFDTTEAVLTPLANLDATQQAAIVTGANSLTPRHLTSIGGGLKVAQASLTAAPMSRNVAIVFTDGYENTAPMIASVEPGVLSAGTEVYSVGLGDPAYLSTAALAALAASSKGKFFQTTDPLVLRKQFVEVLADAFLQNMAADPIIILRQGVAAVVPVHITSCESWISFVLLWEDPAAQVQFTVQLPTVRHSTARRQQITAWSAIGKALDMRFSKSRSRLGQPGQWARASLASGRC